MSGVTYDARGNMAGVNGEAHTYDMSDRHRSTTKGTTTISYVRDAGGRVVSRTNGGGGVHRFGHAAIGDVSSLVMNASNVLVEATLSLPGGALLTTRTGGNVWSYPTLHGDIGATASQAGVKQGASVVYEPFGTAVSGLCVSLAWTWYGRRS